MNNIVITLGGITTTAKHHDVKKCECAARLMMTRKDNPNDTSPPINIKYEAQYSDDGKDVSVSIYGFQ